MLKPRNLFFLLAAVGGIMALIFYFLVSPSASMPEQSHLVFMFVCMMGVFGVTGLIYWMMEKVKRPVSPKIGMWHYIITLLAVSCGIICTITAFDGVENATWTKVPGFLSIKLFTLSVGIFLFGLARAMVLRRQVI